MNSIFKISIPSIHFRKTAMTFNVHYACSLSIQNMYTCNNICDRIEQFSKVDGSLVLGQVVHLPRVCKPQFLREDTAKGVLEEVKLKNISNNIRILHALAHIECNAFMSYVDTYFRFAHQFAGKQLQFQNSIREIALEEGKHFNMLDTRLKQLGCFYGAIAVIPKLTNSIAETEDNVFDRIAVISIIHEGHGVKSVNKLIKQLEAAKDNQSKIIVEMIKKDEVKHFENGWRWFNEICSIKKVQPSTVITQINAKYRANIQIQK